jgi:hypothetical protein
MTGAEATDMAGWRRWRGASDTGGREWTAAVSGTHGEAVGDALLERGTETAVGTSVHGPDNAFKARRGRVAATGRWHADRWAPHAAISELKFTLGRK